MFDLLELQKCNLWYDQGTTKGNGNYSETQFITCSFHCILIFDAVVLKLIEIKRTDDKINNN